MCLEDGTCRIIRMMCRSDHILHCTDRSPRPFRAVRRTSTKWYEFDFIAKVRWVLARNWPGLRLGGLEIHPGPGVRRGACETHPVGRTWVCFSMAKTRALHSERENA